MPNSSEFSARQRRTRFVKEYLLDPNATQAAIKAGYSEKTAKQAGSRLLKDPQVQAAIESTNAEVHEKLDITIERVREEIATLAFSNPQDFFRADGTPKPITELTRAQAACLAGMDVCELFSGNGEERSVAGYLKKIKMASKLEALELLGRHLKMFTDNVDLNLPLRQLPDADLSQQIIDLERRLGLTRQIDDASAVGIAAARAQQKNGAAKD